MSDYHQWLQAAQAEGRRRKALVDSQAYGSVAEGERILAGSGGWGLAQMARDRLAGTDAGLQYGVTQPGGYASSTPGAALQQPPGTGVAAGSLGDKYQQQADAAKDATAKRLADTLAGYDERRKTVLSYLAPGAAESNGARAVRLNYANGRAALQERGMGQSSVAGELGVGYARDLKDLTFQQQMQLAGLDANLSADRLRVMESVNDTGPDPHDLIDLEKARGSGNTSELTAPAGVMAPPVIRSANPYGGGSGLNYGGSPEGGGYRSGGDPQGDSFATTSGIRTWARKMDQAAKYGAGYGRTGYDYKTGQMQPEFGGPPIAQPPVVKNAFTDEEMAERERLHRNIELARRPRTHGLSMTGRLSYSIPKVYLPLP